MIIPDAEVLQRWVIAANAGDDEARQRLLSVAYQILREHFHGVDDGDELAHCAVLKVADCPKLLTFEFRTRDAYRRWVLKFAGNVRKTHAKKQKRQVEVPQGLAAQQRSVATLIDIGLLVRRIRARIAEWTTAWREAIERHLGERDDRPEHSDSAERGCLRRALEDLKSEFEAESDTLLNNRS